MTQSAWLELVQILVLFLLLSVVFEAAMTTVFNWRWFAKRFEGRGVKTPLTVVLAWIVVDSFNVDLVSRILNVVGGGDHAATFSGQVLTALLIAGGSDMVYRIFTRLGIRNSAERAAKAAEARAAAAARRPAAPKADAK